MRKLAVALLPQVHGYIGGGAFGPPRAPEIQLIAEALNTPPINPVLSDAPRSQDDNRRMDDIGKFSGMVSPVSMGGSMAGSTSRLPALSASDIWAMLEPSCGHLEPADRLLVRECVEVLLAKISTAERAERACLSELRISLGADAPLPVRSPPAEVLLVLSSVRTARDLLQLKCDAASVCAAMLSQALTPRAPTWPGGVAGLTDTFMAEVSDLLDQQLRLRAIGSAAADLDDAQAEAVREALRRGLGVRTDAAPTVHFSRPADADVDHLAPPPLAGVAPPLMPSCDVFASAHEVCIDDDGEVSTRAELPSGVVLTCDSSLLEGTPTVTGSTNVVSDGKCSSSGGGAAAQVASWAESDPRVLVVLLGGALAGLRAAEALPPAQQQQRALESVQLFAPLAHSVGLGGSAFAELESLSYARLFPDSLRRLRKWYMQAWPDADSLIDQLCELLDGQLRIEPSLAGVVADVRVTGRVKTVTSTFRKLLRDNVGGRADGVRDALALRVVLTPTDDAAAHIGVDGISPEEAEALICFGAYRAMLRVWTEVDGRFKDFVTKPKANGYQSLHTNVRLPDGRSFEVQIRTSAMHERASSGSASHNAYRAAQLGGSERTTQLLLPQGQSLLKLLPQGEQRALPQADAVTV